MTIHNDILMRLPNWVSTQSKYICMYESVRFEKWLQMYEWHK